ncbi:ExeA family protein [Salinimonas lutimaris]|uniref:ExeA family protein n=1 Tax=Salinimonas lutimaris TaxID=914153 RepID=UPI0010BFD33A|nr:AAA family ATPase [Salinimonas lutimaris]
MYLYHFGIRELPFTLTPNTSYYFGLPSHNEALEVLLTALKTGEGFIKVTGEVGTGKTLLCRKLLNELPGFFHTAYIPNPMLSPEDLRRAVASELEVELGESVDAQSFTQKIQQRLMAIHQQNKSVVLIIDEAQALPDDTMEALRLMTNLETESRKLLQVVLFGQPELDEKLACAAFRQLRQRITFSYALKLMDADQIFQYVAHRMQVAGYANPPVFTPRCCQLLYKASGGIPRIVNVLCHKALMLAYGEGRAVVIPADIRLAAKDTEAARTPASLMIPAALCGLFGVTLMAALLWHSGVSL